VIRGGLGDVGLTGRAAPGDGHKACRPQDGGNRRAGGRPHRRLVTPDGRPHLSQKPQAGATRWLFTVTRTAASSSGSFISVVTTACSAPTPGTPGRLWWGFLLPGTQKRSFPVHVKIQAGQRRRKPQGARAYGFAPGSFRRAVSQQEPDRRLKIRRGPAPIGRHRQGRPDRPGVADRLEDTGRKAGDGRPPSSGPPPTSCRGRLPRGTPRAGCAHW